MFPYTTPLHVVRSIIGRAGKSPLSCTAGVARHISHIIVTCVGGSKAPPIPLLPLVWKRAVWPILNIKYTMMSQLVSTYYCMCYNSLASVLSARGKLALDNHNKTNNVRFYRSLHDLQA